MEYADIIHRCFRCGYCKLTRDYEIINCPSYRKYRFETFSPGGRMWLLRAWREGELNPGSRLAEIFYACASCGNCELHCVMDFRDNLTDIFTTARGELVEHGLTPPAARDIFKNLQISGNPYKQPQEERGSWADGLEIVPYKGQEYLLYVGCIGSYDEKGKQIARCLVQVLKQVGYDIGILGNEETCDGNDVRVMGETGLFQLLAENNISTFNEKGVKKIITLSPHGFNVFRNEYPKLGAQFEVLHYSQAIARSILDNQLEFGEFKARVTLQDPCYLGRHNDEYEAPRQILAAIPGVSLIEMKKNQEDSGCCGGGGGNIFTDILGAGPESPARIRIKEALDTGAEILAVTCPGCARMLEDAVKSENLDEQLKVMDLAEIIYSVGIK